MTRAKVDGAPVYETFPEADQAIRRIGQIDMRVKAVESDMTKEMQKIKESAANKTADLLEERRQIEKNLKDFAIFNRNIFDKKKSKVLNFGKMGFRLSTKLVTIKGWTWKRVIAKLEELQLSNLLKISKNVDKEAVKNSGRTKAEMREFGVEISTEDEFYYEVDEAKVADTAGMGVVRKAG